MKNCIKAQETNNFTLNKQKMKIAIVGYGKMGKLIAKLAQEAGHELVATIGSTNKEKIKTLSQDSVDVAIEFSHPTAALENYAILLSKGIPVVTGTTGWHDKLSDVREMVAEANGTLFYASNFSIGVNIVFKLNKMLAKLMEDHKDYTLTIKEIHHTTKKDAPSGTAISLAEQIIDNNSNLRTWQNKSTEKSDIIPILSERIADAKGFHEVDYSSDVDTIQLRHNAKSREGFAKGALMAATWVKEKKGLFTMEDLLQ